MIQYCLPPTKVAWVRFLVLGIICGFILLLVPLLTSRIIFLQPPPPPPPFPPSIKISTQAPNLLCVMCLIFNILYIHIFFFSFFFYHPNCGDTLSFNLTEQLRKCKNQFCYKKSNNKIIANKYHFLGGPLSSYHSITQTLQHVYDPCLCRLKPINKKKGISKLEHQELKTL